MSNHMQYCDLKIKNQKQIQKQPTNSNKQTKPPKNKQTKTIKKTTFMVGFLLLFYFVFLQCWDHFSSPDSETLPEIKVDTKCLSKALVGT